MLKKVSAIVIPTVIAVGIIAIMLARVWDDLIIALDNADPAYLVISVVVCIAAWFVRGYRYRNILDNLGERITVLLSTACIFISQTANLIIPARLGDLVRLLILKHERGTNYPTGLSSLVVERFFDIAVIALLGAAAVPFILNIPDWFISVIYVTLALCAAFVLFLLFSGSFSSENKYLALLIGLLNEVRSASLRPVSLIYLGFVSLVIWIMDSLICYVIALMFSVNIPFLVVILAIVIGNLVKAVPLTPGGVGTYEVALALTFEISGVAPAVATLIAVIDHLVKNLVTLGGGIISMYLFGDWSVKLLKRAFSKGIDKGEII